MEIKIDDKKQKALNGLVSRYPNIPFLLIFKTIDFAKNLGSSFDNLEDFEGEYPITYETDEDKWKTITLIEHEVKRGIHF